MNLPQRAVLGSMHAKEAALRAPFRRIGVELLVPGGFDTDRWGSFAGDVQRRGSMEEAARAKARAAMIMTGLPVGLASEGSYGPHPFIPFLPLGLELLIWIDDENGVEIVETMSDPAPCFDHLTVRSAAEAEAFLQRTGFPETGLIVAPFANAGPLPATAKGVRARAELDEAVASAGCRSPEGLAVIQTDMRAHMNPKRMSTIASLGERLVQRLATPCPACRSPGFGKMRPGPGLPCSWCGTPTHEPSGEQRVCETCGHAVFTPRIDGRDSADPGACPACNP